MASEILGTAGDNRLQDTSAAEVISGLDGNDTLINLSNFDTLYGGNGADILRISQPSAAYLHVVAFGDAGNDLLRMMPACDSANLFGGDGADTLHGTGQLGYFAGGSGADVIIGGPGTSYRTNRILAYGDSGADTLTGIWNAYGGDGADLLRHCHIAAGGNGRDTLMGTGLDDFLSDDGTDARRNFFYGGYGHDQITGGIGSDRIEGGRLGDTISGSYGDDVIYGGGGRDLIAGGFGRDQLWGGTGADVFVFSAAAEMGIQTTADVIKDFVPGQDRIELAFDTLHFIGTRHFSQTAGEVRFEASTHRLQIDTDGNGTTDASLVLVGVTALTAHDLIL